MGKWKVGDEFVLITKTRYGVLREGERGIVTEVKEFAIGCKMPDRCPDSDHWNVSSDEIRHNTKLDKALK